MRQLVNWFRRKQMDRDLDRELQYHLDRRITDLRNSGLPAHEARKRAMQELGGIVQTQEELLQTVPPDRGPALTSSAMSELPVATLSVSRSGLRN